MSHRSLALLAGLTLGDYLLWNWSLGDGNAVLAIVSGLSLLPLLLATAWLFTISLARVLARGTGASARRARRVASPARTQGPRVAPLRSQAVRVDADGEAARVGAATASADKLAA